MKKLNSKTNWFVFICICFMLPLTACGSNEATLPLMKGKHNRQARVIPYTVKNYLSPTACPVTDRVAKALKGWAKI